MLEIALCDDEPGQVAQTGGLLRGYLAARPRLGGRLTSFSSPQALLQRAAEQHFDIYVLDILMPGLSGIELGLRLRQAGCEGTIVYLSTSPEYAVDSYRVRAFYYLLKPVQPARLYEVLDQAAALAEKRQAARVTVKTKNGLRVLPLGEVCYVELVGRAARYYLTSGEAVDSVTLRGPFQAAVAPLLADRRFLPCGASFAVNLEQVAAVEKAGLTMADGRQLPLPRGQYTLLKKLWMEHWLQGEAQQ